MARFNPNVEEAMRAASRRSGVPMATLRAFATVESGGRPEARTGSYNGLFQLSREQFKKFGGSGNIYDPMQNSLAAANKIKSEAMTFERSAGRPPTAFDLYMQHQQGPSGYRAHRENPDAPAWQNINRFYKSPEVAKSAVWGNIPASVRSQYGSVEKVPSRVFLADGWWGSRFERAGGGNPRTPLAFANQTSETPATPASQTTQSSPTSPTATQEPWQKIPPLPRLEQTSASRFAQPMMANQTSGFQPPEGMVDPMNPGPEPSAPIQPMDTTQTTPVPRNNSQNPRPQLDQRPDAGSLGRGGGGGGIVSPVAPDNNWSQRAHYPDQGMSSGGMPPPPPPPPSTDDWLMNKFPQMGMLFSGGGGGFGGGGFGGFFSGGG